MIVNEPQDNYKTGWIKLFRSIKQHWIWIDPVKFKWWIDILLEVNHSDKKVPIGYNLFQCDRGQSVKSLFSWGEQWGVSKDKARNFLKMLEKDNMITLENLSKTTRLTVCNYDSYQDGLHDDTTQPQRYHNDSQTLPHANKNDNNNKERKEDKKYNIRTDLLSLNVEKEIIDSWLLIRKNKKAVNTKIAFNAVKREIEKTTLSANECLNIAVEKSWAGFKAEWIKNETNESHEINRRRNEQKPTRAEEAVNGITARLEEAHRLETQG